MSDKRKDTEVSDRSRDFFATISEGCLRRIDRATVAVLGIQFDKIVHDRTGVLYRIGGEHFILTASHDLHDIVAVNIPLYVSMNKPGVLPLALGTAKFHSSDDEVLDLAAIWLPTDLAKEVAQHKDFLPHSQIDYAAASRSGPFVFFGYPMSWSGHVVTEDFIVSQALAFAAFPHRSDREPTAHYDPNVHMLLNFTREAIDPADGTIEKLPRLNGISGCGIWQVGDISGNVTVPRTEKSVTLVGIQNRWFPHLDYVQGTQISHALEFIRKNFSGAAAAMNIVYPARRP